MKIWTKPSPSTTPAEPAPELPTALPTELTAGVQPGAGWSGPVPTPRRPRRSIGGMFKRHPFFWTVLVPTVFAAVYFFAIAAPQYVSEARFVVRGRSAAPSSPLSEAISSAGFRATSEDAAGVKEYILSLDAVGALRQRLDLVALFRRPEADPVSRLWWAEPPAERLFDYFVRMISVEPDITSGIVTLKVRAFRPEDSQALAEGLLALSEGLINRLNVRMQEDSLRVAREELERAENRVLATQSALTVFRERERSVDPNRSAALALETVARLENQLAQTQAELSEAGNFARADAPRMVTLRNRVDALTRQVAEERRRISSTDAGLSQQIGEYERLSALRDLARAQLVSATNSMERARIDAQRQQIFLLRVVQPNLPEYARFPHRYKEVLYLFIVLSVAFGLGWLLVAGTREHAA
jgi:capsular polysaccharide transport system permease protein